MNKQLTKIENNKQQYFTHISSGQKLKGKDVLLKWRQIDKLPKAEQNEFDNLSLDERIAVIKGKKQFNKLMLKDQITDKISFALAKERMFNYFNQWR